MRDLRDLVERIVLNFWKLLRKFTTGDIHLMKDKLSHAMNDCLGKQIREEIVEVCMCDSLLFVVNTIG